MAVTIRKEQITIIVVSVSFTNSNACNPHVDITKLHLTPSLCLYSLGQTSCLSSIFTGWCDAAYKCTKPCPNGGVNVVDGVEESECPEGETCFAGEYNIYSIISLVLHIQNLI